MKKQIFCLTGSVRQFESFKRDSKIERPIYLHSRSQLIGLNKEFVIIYKYAEYWKNQYYEEIIEMAECRQIKIELFE